MSVPVPVPVGILNHRTSETSAVWLRVADDCTMATDGIDAYERLELMCRYPRLIHKARHRSTGQIVVLKRICLKDEEDGVPGGSLREVNLLRELGRHDFAHLTKLFDVCHTSRALYICLEYCDCDLKHYMRLHGNRLTLPELQSFSWSIPRIES